MRAAGERRQDKYSDYDENGENNPAAANTRIYAANHKRSFGCEIGNSPFQKLQAVPNETVHHENSRQPMRREHRREEYLVSQAGHGAGNASDTRCFGREWSSSEINGRRENQSYTRYDHPEPVNPRRHYACPTHHREQPPAPVPPFHSGEFDPRSRNTVNPHASHMRPHRPLRPNAPEFRPVRAAAHKNRRDAPPMAYQQWQDPPRHHRETMPSMRGSAARYHHEEARMQPNSMYHGWAHMYPPAPQEYCWPVPQGLPIPQDGAVRYHPPVEEPPPCQMQRQFAEQCHWMSTRPRTPQQAPEFPDEVSSIMSLDSPRQIPQHRSTREIREVMGGRGNQELQVLGCTETQSDCHSECITDDLCSFTEEDSSDGEGKPFEEIETEIRVTSGGNPMRTIKYGKALFLVHGCRDVVVRALGQATEKAVRIANGIAEEVPGLHIVTRTGVMRFVRQIRPHYDASPRPVSDIASCIGILLTTQVPSIQETYQRGRTGQADVVMALQRDAEERRTMNRRPRQHHPPR